MDKEGLLIEDLEMSRIERTLVSTAGKDESILYNIEGKVIITREGKKYAVRLHKQFEFKYEDSGIVLFDSIQNFLQTARNINEKYILTGNDRFEELWEE